MAGNKLKLNPDKTELIIFDPKNNVIVSTTYVILLELGVICLNQLLLH